VEAIGNYARLKYYYNHNITDATEASINSLGVSLRNTYAISFDDLKSYPEPVNGYIGVCCKNNNKILIDKGFWDTYNNQVQRNLLIMHELGHCDTGLRRSHTADSIKSIMNPVIITPYIYDPEGKDGKSNGELNPTAIKHKYDRELYLKTLF